MIDPTGMWGVTYGAAGYSSPSEWANAKEQERKADNTHRKQQDRSYYYDNGNMDLVGTDAQNYFLGLRKRLTKNSAPDDIRPVTVTITGEIVGTATVVSYPDGAAA